jgi:hypothetical protein
VTSGCKCRKGLSCIIFLMRILVLLNMQTTVTQVDQTASHTLVQVQDFLESTISSPLAFVLSSSRLDPTRLRTPKQALVRLMSAER